VPILDRDAHGEYGEPLTTGEVATLLVVVPMTVRPLADRGDLPLSG
jgi:hypothetical protein